MKITAYKLIQAEGNRELAAEIGRFIATGWEPHGSPILVGTTYGSPEPHAAKELRRIYAQAIVKAEPESAQIERLRDSIHRALTMVDAARDGVISEAEALRNIRAVIHE